MLAAAEPKSSEGIELEAFDPQVVIIDDKESDVRDLENAFNNLNIGSQYLKADDTEPNFPNKPFENVKLVFLDLVYKEHFGGDNFDAYICADWLKHTIPEGKKYILVIWSKDIGNTAELIAAIQETGGTIPFEIIQKSKSEYLINNVEDNIQKMLGELGIRIKGPITDVQEFYGKVIDIEEDAVLINCLLNENPKFFEVRRFDLQPFQGYIDLREGIFLRIKVTTKPGSRTIDFANEDIDISEKFVKPDAEIIDDSDTIDWLNASK